LFSEHQTDLLVKAVGLCRAHHNTKEQAALKLEIDRAKCNTTPYKQTQARYCEIVCHSLAYK